MTKPGKSRRGSSEGNGRARRLEWKSTAAIGIAPIVEHVLVRSDGWNLSAHRARNPIRDSVRYFRGIVRHVERQ